MKRKSLGAATTMMFLFLSIAFSVQADIGTAFTYQGRLTDGPGSTNGTYDFEFRLYGSLDGSDSIGSMVPKDNVTVANGLFTVLLDFGSSPFAGEARWLEVKIRPDGGGAFFTLAPRQPMTPAPYALYAPSAGTVGSVPWSSLTGMPAGFADGIDNDTQYTAGTGLNLSGTQFRLLSSYQMPQGCVAGQVPKSDGVAWTCQADSDTTYAAGTGLNLAGGQFSILPLFQLPQAGCSTGYMPKWTGLGWNCSPDIDTTYSAGTGLSLSAGQFSVAAPYRLPQACTNNYVPKWNSSTSQWVCATDNDTTTYWGLTGNSGTTPGTQYIGTADNVALEFKVNNTRALRIEPNTESPNFIGGYSGNNVSAGVVGATIGGGGSNNYPNHVTVKYGTIGGGFANIGGYVGTIYNPNFPTVDSGYVTVGGGNSNVASGGYATVGGGNANVASGYIATIGGE